MSLFWRDKSFERSTNALGVSPFSGAYPTKELTKFNVPVLAWIIALDDLLILSSLSLNSILRKQPLKLGYAS